MNLQFSIAPPESIAADALAVLCFEKPGDETSSGSAVQSSELADPKIAEQSGWLADLRTTGEFAGKLYETAILHRPEGIGARRLAVIGAGKREKFSPAVARRVAAALIRSLRGKGVHNLALLLEQADAALVRSVTEGAILGAWDADKYKTDPKKNLKQTERIHIRIGSKRRSRNLLWRSVSRCHA